MPSTIPTPIPTSLSGGWRFRTLEEMTNQWGDNFRSELSGSWHPEMEALLGKPIHEIHNEEIGATSASTMEKRLKRKESYGCWGYNIKTRDGCWGVPASFNVWDSTINVEIIIIFQCIAEEYEGLDKSCKVLLEGKGKFDTIRHIHHNKDGIVKVETMRGFIRRGDEIKFITQEQFDNNL